MGADLDLLELAHPLCPPSSPSDVCHQQLLAFSSHVLAPPAPDPQNLPPLTCLCPALGEEPGDGLGRWGHEDEGFPEKDILVGFWLHRGLMCGDWKGLRWVFKNGQQRRVRGTLTLERAIPPGKLPGRWSVGSARRRERPWTWTWETANEMENGNL